MWFYLHVGSLILAWNSTKSASLDGLYPKLQFSTSDFLMHSHECGWKIFDLPCLPLYVLFFFLSHCLWTVWTITIWCKTLLWTWTLLPLKNCSVLSLLAMCMWPVILSGTVLKSLQFWIFILFFWWKMWRLCMPKLSVISIFVASSWQFNMGVLYVKGVG